MIKLYNTFSRKKEVFKPIKKGHVGIYTCGPTVYWYQHIGNLRTYIFSDVLRRVFEYNGYNIDHIINVTDVGHLTSDSDDGDDKVELAAKREGKSAEQITKFYFDEFSADCKKLNILEPKRWVWATKHIKEQIDLIELLEKKGFVYQTSDGIYFDTSKFSDYGKFSRKKISALEGGKRVSLGEKKNKTDFALWKFSGNGQRLQEWDSPWGKGFPGWHIECSAMSTKYLGKHFDIHTGGVDHASVHHENEIAQSRCGYGSDPWVNIWMHGEFLITNNGKMAKSSGKIKRLCELEAEGVDPLAFRYFTYTAHYRKPLTWSDESIASAVQSYKRLRNLMSQLPKGGSPSKEYLAEFSERINNDLDMPGAIAVLWKLLRDDAVSDKWATVKKMDEVFALDLLEEKSVFVPKEVLDLASKREVARKNKEWGKADDLRKKINVLGWSLNDTASGPQLEKDD